MKLIRCKWCGDVVNLCREEWRKCMCKASGGQYKDDNQIAVVGGKCEVIAIRNDFFNYEPFSKERQEGERDKILQGEYEGDKQIIRLKSSRRPRKNLNRYPDPV